MDGNETEENAGESEENTEKKSEENAFETEASTEKSKGVFPAGDQAEITKEASTGSGAWSTELVESQNEKKAQVTSIKWKVCNVTAGPDYIPCLGNWQAIRKLHSTKHYEHHERHCPEESPRCLFPLPEGYRRSIKRPKSREKLAEVKGHQNLVKMSGEYLFPAGEPVLYWMLGVVLLASEDIFLTEMCSLCHLHLRNMDEHEAQVQFALECGILAMSNVMCSGPKYYKSQLRYNASRRWSRFIIIRKIV